MSNVRRAGGAVVIWVLAALAIGGCGSGESGTATGLSNGAQVVEIANYTYKPETLTVAAGTKVAFVNHDSTAHTATAKQNGAFATEPIQPGKRATVVLGKPGTFIYYCVFHPFMKGTIKVE
jgi:plastocyanin